MNVLITGSQGFLAMNLAKSLNKKNINIYGIGRGKLSKKKIKETGYKKNIISTISPKSLSKYSNTHFHTIVHCAGKVIGSEPNDDFEKNVLSTQYILDFASKLKKKPKLIFLSTLAVYGNSKKKILKENTLINPVSNYAQNKLLAEELIKYYSKNFGIKYEILRTGSLYGIGLRRQFIYDACKKIYSKNNIFFGTGREVRDWLYADDLVDLIYIIIKKKALINQIFNVGSGQGLKISEVIVKISELMKIKIKPTFNKIGIDKNPRTLISDITVAKKKGWTPKTSFDEGLKKYVQWFLYDKKN